MNDLAYLAKRQLEMKEYDELSCRHWLMFFRDRDTNIITAYDTKDPQDCYRAIRAKHPSYIFLELRGCDSVSSAVEYAKAFRLVAKTLTWLEARLKARAEIAAVENANTILSPAPSGPLSAAS